MPVQGNDKRGDEKALTIQIGHLLVDVLHEKHDGGNAYFVALIRKGNIQVDPF